MDNIAWNLIDKYFKDNPYNLVAHHLDSYNDFFNKGIFQIFKENNPIRFIERAEEGDEVSNVKHECFLYLGGKTGDKLYFGKPVIYDENENDNSKSYVHYMYPNDARLRNMTYGITIHFDLEVDFVFFEGNERKELTKSFEKIYLGKFPIMLHSDMCILRGLTTEARYNLGECRNDYGGYFIINGKEKVIVSQEKFGDNMLYVRKNKPDALYSHSCEIHSVSEDSSKPIRYTSVKIVAPDASYTNNQIVVDIPNVKKPIPLFILMRALGVISDKSIIEFCLLDLDKNSNMINLFIPSIHDANKIFTQQIALEFISKFTKRQTVSAVQDILMNYFLPHIGEDNFINKAYFIGFMVNKLLRVFQGKEAPTDRDSFKFKRVETSGSLIYDLFREYFLIQNNQIFLKIDKEFYYHPGTYRTNFVSLIENEGNLKKYFKDRTVEDGFRKAFKGNWGADVNTKRVGVIQDLNRLSWFTHICHLRKINLPLDATAKIVGPHLLHSTQWGYVDPVDTPDGANIGLHKHMSISTAITNGFSSYPIIKWLRANTPLKLLTECEPKIIASFTKVFVNGNWIGVLDNPVQTVNTMKLFRRNGIIPVYTSITFNYESNTVYIYTDSGRLTRPIFYRDSKFDNGKIIYGKISYDHGTIKDIISSSKYTWQQAVTGFETKHIENFNMRNNILYDPNTLYPTHNTLEALLDSFETNRAIIDYIDTSEEENTLIAVKPSDFKESSLKYYTHCEIDPSLIFGVMGNSITFPESNQFPRDCFSCSQSRQAVSDYHSNYQMRMDKMGVVLNYGQTPLIKSRYLEYINREEQPYGVNAIVAIMSYTGYNVEDAILINEASIERGLFRTTYYTTYEAREESAKVSGSTSNTFFANVQSKPNVKKLKEGFDYSKLDEYGLVRENTPIDDRIVLIGELTTSLDQRGVYTDNSKTTKKGQLGFVDKAFMSEGEEGYRIAKIRIREERLPAIGDKMASRNGQKGTLGLIIPEEDMPFTADGIRPDLIINPHAIPSRMTIGQLVECLFGKACAEYGAYGDCTAFSSKGSNYDTYGEMLTKAGYHNSGNQILYNGFTGEQLYSEIYIGPTYYMRLKHMVKDKINYRATGKRSLLTRQTNQGRANDGGLRIGEMERDGIMAHGLSYFLNESFMVRGDEYYMAVCNKTGTIAVYNAAKNVFLSPASDGPLVFNKTLDGNQVLNVYSKYGRSFSLLRIPYSLKLLIQELQVMGIQMRIITEENIDQLLNLSYQSHNIDKLLHIDNLSNADIKTIIENYKNDMDKKFKSASNEKYNYTVEQSPISFQEGLDPMLQEFIRNADPKLKAVYKLLKPEYMSKFNGYNDEYKIYLLNRFYEFSKDPTKHQMLLEDVLVSLPEPSATAPEFPDFVPPPGNNKFAPESPYFLPESPDFTPPPGNRFVPKSPDFSPEPPVANRFVPESPDFSPEPPVANRFVPESPDFSPEPPVANRFVPESPDFSPEPPGTSASRGGNGNANIFLDPVKNNVFRQLPSDKQSIILQMDYAERENIMNQIIRERNLQSTIKHGGGTNVLTDYFNRLPPSNQIAALKGGYTAVTKDIGKIGGAIPKPVITIHKPVDPTTQLYNQFPHLKPQGSINVDTIEADSSNNNNNESSESSSSSSSTSGSVKKIIM
jgi:DNA-directed RNA polymerase II subunit RPB2